MLKFIRGPRTSETMKFMTDDAPILIGRNFDCHIQVASDESISRYQSRIDFVDNKWILKDGDGHQLISQGNNHLNQEIEQQKGSDYDDENKHKSTNGTWIFCNKEEELKG